jgi:phosphoenolpyruvate-protein kinase (PTS system EI component)
MAQQPEYIAFLIGIGVRILSMDPANIPLMQQTIEKLDVAETQDLAQKVLARTTVEKIAKILNITRQTAGEM